MLRTSLRLALVCLVCSILSDCTHESRITRIDQTLAKAANFLIQRQGSDGAWRSGVHGSFRDGPSLTPHVLSTLFFVRDETEGGRDAYGRATEYLSRLIEQDDAPALHFPVYTSAAASWVAVLDGRTPEALKTQAKWLDYVRARQLNAKLGWNSGDAEFGGWGYSPMIPIKPNPGEARHPLVASNISATIYALGALRSAQVSMSDPACRDALRFVMRCQNFQDNPDQRDERFDDGGFFFQPDDAATNKAGPAGTDRLGRMRYHSYGSATCDGLRALLACGLAPDHPRTVAARKWIEKNFTVTTNPGTFASDRESIRAATYYYYCWSLAHALRRLQLHEIDTPRGRVHWATVLADELIRRQRPDGSWKNDLTDAKEDDPLVATAFAGAALALCREEMPGAVPIPPR